MNCPHCNRRLEDDGISLRCSTHGPIEISPSPTPLALNIAMGRNPALGTLPKRKRS